MSKGNKQGDPQTLDGLILIATILVFLLISMLALIQFVPAS